MCCAARILEYFLKRANSTATFLIGMTFYAAIRLVLVIFLSCRGGGGTNGNAAPTLMICHETHPFTANESLSSCVNIVVLAPEMTTISKDIVLTAMSFLLSPYHDSLISILTSATSGDTGSAALEAMSVVKGCYIVVMLPRNRISPVQELLMTTVIADNCQVIRGLSLFIIYYHLAARPLRLFGVINFAVIIHCVKTFTSERV